MKHRKKLTLTEKATKALREAVAKAVEEHRRLGIPLAIWRDGKAVAVPAEELMAPQKAQRKPAKPRQKAKRRRPFVPADEAD